MVRKQILFQLRHLFAAYNPVLFVAQVLPGKMINHSVLIDRGSGVSASRILDSLLGRTRQITKRSASNILLIYSLFFTIPQKELFNSQFNYLIKPQTIYRGVKFIFEISKVSSQSLPYEYRYTLISLTVTFRIILYLF